MRNRYAAAAAALVLACALGGCASDEEPDADEQPSSTPSGSAEPTPSESASQDATASPSEATSAPAGGGELPAPGSADAPAAVTAAPGLLDWKESDDPERAIVTAGTKYVAIAAADGKTASVGTANSGDIRDVRAPKGFHVGDVLLDGEWAVVVAQHDAESKPSVATVVNLSTGDTRTLDGKSNPATVNGGSWAIGQGRVFHATIGRDKAYCLAEVDLASGEGQTSYCAEKNTGFNNVRVTPDGLSLMSFDSGQVSCRTVITVGEAAMEPMAGAPKCRAWEGFMLAGGDSVFTVVEKENRIERSRVVARVGDGYYDLGSATTGSLVWCDGAAYFSSDPRSPATLAPDAVGFWQPAHHRLRGRRRRRVDPVRPSLWR